MPLSWDEKRKRIEDEHPEALEISWSGVMREDPDVFARILGDVIRSSGGSSRPGKRPTLDRGEASAVLLKLLGEDFSEYSFRETFRIMIGKDSMRKVAERTGLALSFVHKLLKSDAQPSYETMSKIAVAYEKEPSFFLEYRIGFVLSIIEDFLTSSPETATSYFQKMRRA